MRGGDRRTKPEPLRTLHNSRTRARHRPSAPLEAVTALEAPPGLSDAEQTFWAYYMPKLAAVHLLTGVDRDVLADYCRARAEIDDIRQQQGSQPYRRVLYTAIIDDKGKRTGVKAASHPLDLQLRNWLQIARLAGAELGLSPVSRARVAPIGLQTEDDELEKFIQAPLRRVR